MTATKVTIDQEERKRLPENIVKLFSESNSRFVIEVTPESATEIEKTFAQLPLYRLGTVVESNAVRISAGSAVVIEQSTQLLRDRWQAPLDL